MEYFKKFENYNPPENVHISDNCRDVLERMITVDMTKRITAKELLKHRLFDDVDSSVSLVHEPK